MDLRTDYLGLALKHPVAVSAGPLTDKLESIKELEDASASAIVLHSLFEEDIGEVEPGAGRMGAVAETYLGLLQSAKESVEIPVIGSLNGITSRGWVDYAGAIEDAGADALELNFYQIAADPEVSGADIERELLDIVKAVKRRVSIPVAVKLSPFFSSIGNIARQLCHAGADGLVLFNRFYQPDFDIAKMKVHAHLELSTSAELHLPLRWIAILSGKVPVDFALTSGVHTAEDVVKAMFAGANVTLLTSELLQKGPGRIREIVGDLVQWMETHGHGAVAELSGRLSQGKVKDPIAFERGNYLKFIADQKAALRREGE